MSEPSPYSAHYFPVDGTNNSWSNMYQFVPEGARVLDVGCSIGNYGAALKELKGCSVVGIDISSVDIEIAETRLDAAYVLDITNEQEALKLGKFDVIVCADVLEHLPEARTALRIIKKLLRNDGVVVFSIPNMGHASVRFDLLGGRFGYTEMGLLDRTHLHFFDRDEVESVFADSGFSITEESPTVVTYPQQMISDRMNSYGLEAGDAFYNMLEQTEAEIFQYVGVAVPHEADFVPPHPTGFSNPADEIFAYAESAILAKQALAEQLADTKIELHAVQSRLHAIRTRPVRTILAALGRRLTGSRSR